MDSTWCVVLSFELACVRLCESDVGVLSCLFGTLVGCCFVLAFGYGSGVVFVGSWGWFFISLFVSFVWVGFCLSPLFFFEYVYMGVVL